VKKNRLEFSKKPTGSVGFNFTSLKLKKLNRTQTEKNKKKTEPNLAKTKLNWKKIEPKPSQTKKTKPNQFEPVFVLKNQTEPNQNQSV
jgi:hypothetical protein